MKLNLVLYKPKKTEFSAVYVNGEAVEFKRAGAALTAECQTDGNFEIRVVKKSLLSVNNWFLWSFLCWLAGIFGLFFPRYKKTERMELFYSASGTIFADAQIKIKLNPPGVNAAVEITSPVPVKEEGNVWIDNQKVKKRRKATKVCTVLFWIFAVLAAAAIAAYILIFKG